MKVTAALNKHIYDPNEELECRIELISLPDTEEEQLGFLSAEIRCIFRLDSAKDRAINTTIGSFSRSSESLVSSGEGMFSIPQPKEEKVIFTTQPIILNCDARVEPGSIQRYSVRLVLPNSLLPSFQESRFGLKYFVRIVTQLARGRVNMLNIPFIVFPSENYGYIVHRRNLAVTSENVETVTDNFFLMKLRYPQSSIDLIDGCTSPRQTRRGSQVFISNGGTRIARLSFETDTYELGDVIDCMCEIFTEADIPCVSISSRLHNVLSIDGSFLKELREVDGKLQKDQEFDFSEVGVNTRNLGSFHTQIPIPTRACISFSSNICKYPMYTYVLKSFVDVHPAVSSVWSLRFTFIQEDPDTKKPTTFHYEYPINVEKNRRHLEPKECLREMFIKK